MTVNVYSYDSDCDVDLVSVHDSIVKGKNIIFAKLSFDHLRLGKFVGVLGAPLLLLNSFCIGTIMYFSLTSLRYNFIFPSKI